MQHSTCLFAVLASFVVIQQILVATSHNAEANDRPNILLIVSDDQGYNDLGLMGNGIITPHLNRIAREGVRLTNFYVTWPACTPSRASLLTGRYPQRNGISDMIRNEAPDYGYKYKPAEYAVSFERIGGMDEREKTIADVLKKRGYHTAIFGKWDLGSLKRYLPTSRGFDEFYGFVNTGIDYYTHERYGVPSMFSGESQTEKDKGTYCTTLFERESLRFLERWAGKEPFFLYVPFNAPHNSSALASEIRSSIQAPDEFKQMYPPVEKEFRTTSKYRYDAPATVVTPEARTRDYRAAVTCMDASIGKMINLLEQRQCLDETIVIFFSDNGGGGGADNSPLRGKKATLWEGGVRVPCLVRWPDGGVGRESVVDEFVTSLELFPSLAAAAGAKLPRDVTLDGFNWWLTVRGKQPSLRKVMFWKRKDQLAARVGRWKWVKLDDKKAELFNLEIDRGETMDVSGQNPEVVEEIENHYQSWLKEMEESEPRGPFRDF